MSGRFDRTRLVGCALAAAVTVAPFLALLYGLDAALAVMALALGAAAGAAREAARGVDGAARDRLRVAAVANGCLAVACAAALVWRLG